jgi:hypothetical protein
MFQDVEARVRGVATADIRRGSNEMTVSELLRAGDDIAASTGIRIGYRNGTMRAPHTRMAVAFSCIAYMLFGVARAGVRPRVAVPVVLAICITHFMLIASMLSISKQVARLPAAAAWLPTVVLTAAAIAAARCSPRAERSLTAAGHRPV